MFSQRNNPYCELQKISAAKLNIKSEQTIFFEQKKAEDACIISYSFSEFKRKTNGIFGGMREIV